MRHHVRVVLEKKKKKDCNCACASFFLSNQNCQVTLPFDLWPVPGKSNSFCTDGALLKPCSKSGVGKGMGPRMRQTFQKKRTFLARGSGSAVAYNKALTDRYHRLASCCVCLKCGGTTGSAYSRTRPGARRGTNMPRHHRGDVGSGSADSGPTSPHYRTLVGNRNES